MKKLLVAILCSMLVACSSTVQATPSTTATAIPTRTVTLPPTSSPIPSTETPKAQPTSEWNGIPIMPGAIAGEGDDEVYVFTIHATLQQVQEYYRFELEQLGWQSISQEEDDSSATLIFTDDASGMLTVSILSKGEESLVLLAR